MILSIMLWFARRQLPPDYLAALHFADCAIPCWIGIDPGTTTLDEAYPQISALFDNDAIYQAAVIRYPSSESMTLTLQSRVEPANNIVVMLKGRADGVIETISFFFTQKINLGAHAADMQSPVAAITSGKLSSLLGAPSRMIVPNPMAIALDDFVMVYGDDQRGALLSSLDANRESPVMALELYANGKMPVSTSPRFKRWGGFVSMRRYLQLMGRYPW